MKVYVLVSGEYSEFGIDEVYKSWRKPLEIRSDEMQQRYEMACSPNIEWIETLVNGDHWQNEHAEETLREAEKFAKMGYYTWNRRLIKGRYREERDRWTTHRIQVYEVIE